MFEIRLSPLDLYCATGQPTVDRHAFLHRTALAFFNAARRAAFVEKVRSALLHHARQLFCLDAIASCQVHNRHDGGIEPVSLRQIRGSVGRTCDFDHHFHPLHDCLRDRWISVAVARSQSVPLPLVSLVQVDDRDFIEDGHHRVLVARALGETAIDAEVTVWDVSGPLTWKPQPTGRLAWQPA